MSRTFEYRKASKLKRWGRMARTSTKLGREIAIIVGAGGLEPENNPRLCAIMTTCRYEDMPKDNIRRTIKNAMGRDTNDYKEVTYEDYGPRGVTMFVKALTDNTIHAVGDVRSIFNKFNGNFGTQSFLSFLFGHKAVFTFKEKDSLDIGELILDLIDYGVKDEFGENKKENEITVYGEPTNLGEIQRHLEDNGFEIAPAEFTRIPNDLKDVTPKERETIDRVVKRLEDFDDVLNICTNMKPVED